LGVRREVALAACLLAAVVAGCGQSHAKTSAVAPVAGKSAPSGWKTYRSQHGFAVDLPRQWKVVPRTDSSLRLLIAHERAAGHDALATNYASILSDPYQRQKDNRFFHAFQWPLGDVPIETDLLVYENDLPFSDHAHVKVVLDALFDELRKQIPVTRKEVSRAIRHGAPGLSRRR
jgi:hypothetical protein